MRSAAAPVNPPFRAARSEPRANRAVAAAHQRRRLTGERSSFLKTRASAALSCRISSELDAT
jgi:hypothetical protein